jgi:hypothetical protein
MIRTLFLKIGIGIIYHYYRYSGIDDGHLFSRTIDPRVDEKSLGYSVDPRSLEFY